MTRNQELFRTETEAICGMQIAEGVARELGIRIEIDIQKARFRLFYTPKFTDEKRKYYAGKEIEFPIFAESIDHLIDIMKSIKIGTTLQ